MHGRNNYNRKFDGNILIIAKIGWGKTTFTQKLAKNKMFGDLKEIYWIKKIPPSAQREKNILVFKKTLILSIHKL